MVAAVNSVPGMHCHAPEGAFYIFANCSDLIGRSTPDGKRIATDADIQTYLLEEHGVAVLAGTNFGLAGYIRISFAASTKTLQEAGVRLQQACRALC